MTKEMWLFLLKEGGRWCGSELHKAMNLERRRVAVLVGNMADTGQITRYEKTGPRSRVRFAVTPACKIPQGVTLAELMEVGILRKGAE